MNEITALIYDEYHDTSYSAIQLQTLLTSYLEWCGRNNQKPEVTRVEDVSETNIEHVAYHAYIQRPDLEAKFGRSSPRRVYFINELARDEHGNYIPCIAVEGEVGIYHRTDWEWGPDLKLAQGLADEMNARMGYSKKEAMLIQLRTL